MASDLSMACRELSYRILVPSADFDVVQLSGSFGKNAKNSGGWMRIALKSRDSEGFHCHLYWRPEKGKPENIQLQMDFHRWKPETKTPLDKPTSEEAFKWVFRFLSKSAEVEAHVHGEFRLKPDRWQLTILPLPWKLPHGDKSPTIDGISFDLPNWPEGVLGGFAQLGEERLTLQLYAGRKVVFNDFDIAREVDAFVSVAKDLVGER